MAEGKRVTLDEVFKRREAEARAERELRDAWEATPEGKAWREARDAHHARMQQADERFALENPPPDEDEDGDAGDDDEEEG